MVKWSSFCGLSKTSVRAGLSITKLDSGCSTMQVFVIVYVSGSIFADHAFFFASSYTMVPIWQNTVRIFAILLWWFLSKRTSEKRTRPELSGMLYILLHRPLCTSSTVLLVVNFCESWYVYAFKTSHYALALLPPSHKHLPIWHHSARQRPSSRATFVLPPPTSTAVAKGAFTLTFPICASTPSPFSQTSAPLPSTPKGSPKCGPRGNRYPTVTLLPHGTWPGKNAPKTHPSPQVIARF